MLRQVYYDLLFGDVARQFIEEGKYPAQSDLNAAYLEMTGGKDISRPLINLTSLVSEGEDSSVAKYNDMLLKIKCDLTALYKNIKEQVQESLDDLDKAKIELKTLNNRAAELKDKLSSILLSKEETTGYFNHLEESFDNENNVYYFNDGTDDCGTTLAIDTEHGLLRLSNLKQERIPLKQRNFSSSLFGNIKSQQTINNPKDSFEKNNKSWTVTISSETFAPVGVNLFVSLDSLEYINNITLQGNSRYLLTLSYSDDGVTFKRIPGTNIYNHAGTNKLAISFNSIQTKYLKLTFTLSEYTLVDSLYTFKLMLDEVSLYKTTNENSGVYYSKVMLAKDYYQDLSTFSSLSLTSCEILPEDTSIDYSVHLVLEEELATISELSTEETGKTSIHNLDFKAINPSNRAQLDGRVISTESSGRDYYITYNIISVDGTLVSFASTDDINMAEYSIIRDTNNREFMLYNINSSSKRATYRVVDEYGDTTLDTPAIGQVLHLNRIALSDPIDLTDPSKDTSFRDWDANDLAYIDTVFSDNTYIQDTQMFRGVGNNTQYDILGEPKTINQMEIGWIETAEYFETNIYVHNLEGLSLSLGSNEIEYKVEGGTKFDVGKDIVTLPSGIIQVKIHKGYWSPFTIDTTWDTADPGDSVTGIDISRGTNPKYLLEGLQTIGDYIFLYGCLFHKKYILGNMTNPYVGATFYSAHLSNPLSRYELLNHNININKKHAFITDASGEDKILIKYNVGNEEEIFANERYILNRKLVAGSSAVGAIVKIKMERGDADFSPMVESIKLKLSR